MAVRIKTGIPNLDKKIEGGFPLGSSILLVGPPGSGKSTLAHQFIHHGMKNKEPGLYTALDMSPEDIMNEIKRLNRSINRKSITFIDAYSWRFGAKKGKLTLSNLRNINELNIMMTKGIEELKAHKKKRSVFDSISTLLLYAEPSLVVRMIPVIIAKLKGGNFTQIWIMEEGVHDPKTVTAMNYFADGSIEFKMEEDKRFFRISRMKGTKHKRDWIEFDITEKGIKI